MIRRIILTALLLLVSVNVFAISLDVNKTSELHVGYVIKTVIIGSPDVADYKIVESQGLVIFGKKNGETTLTLKGEGGESQVFPITVVDSKAEAVEVNMALVAAGYKDVRAMSLGTSLLISGNVDQREDIEDIKSLISDYTHSVRYALSVRKDQQIKIRVTVAEVSKNISNQLGIDWGSGTTSNSTGNSGGSGGGAESLSISSGYYSARVKGFSFDSLGIAINALAKNNLANVITTPSLTVTNGKTAMFHGGGQIPIFQQNDNGSSVDWKDYGVMLKFSPVINKDASISMDVAVESSQIAGYYKYKGTDLPTLNTRNVKTSIKMKDGDTFVLGGLIDNSQSQSIDKVPYLADIPVIGSLFRSTSFKSGKSELVIFATVEFVQPVQANSIKLPYVKWSSPWELFFSLGEEKDDVTEGFLQGADYVTH